MITVIDYGLGNLASVANALDKLGIPYEISDMKSRLMSAKAFILPGVGAAGQGMKNLKMRGFDKIIVDKARGGIPILGICLGMQLMLSKSNEGDVKCLGLIEGCVKKFRTKLKVPQIGWNNVIIPRPSDSPFVKGGWGDLRQNKLFNKISNNSYFYFVNSYYCDPNDKSVIAGLTDYGGDFCSVFMKENIAGVQFHPEKSGEAGLKMLRNFCRLAFFDSSPKATRSE